WLGRSDASRPGRPWVRRGRVARHESRDEGIPARRVLPRRGSRLAAGAGVGDGHGSRGAASSAVSRRHGQGQHGVTREPSGTAADASATKVHGPLPDAAFLETLPAGFVAMGDDWRVTYVNRAAEELLGRPREAMVGRGLWDLFPWAAGSQLEETLRGVLEIGRAS